MQVEVKVPQLSESVSEATLVSWHKKEGEAVKRDENLIDIETDKIVMELPSPVDGVLVKIVKGDQVMVTSGEVIAVIDTAATAAAPSPKAGAPAASVPAPAQSAAMSPAASKIAAENTIAASDVAGTGRGGRITKEDVIGKLGGAPAPVAVAKPAAPAIQLPLGDRAEQRVPMSRLRARIAERLVQSQSTAAILTTFNEVNMQHVIELRNRYKDKFEKEHGVKLGFMSFFVKAVTHALSKYPIVNASIDGNDIVYHGYYDIGIAVGTERGHAEVT